MGALATPTWSDLDLCSDCHLKLFGFSCFGCTPTRTSLIVCRCMHTAQCGRLMKNWRGLIYLFLLFFTGSSEASGNGPFCIFRKRRIGALDEL